MPVCPAPPAQIRASAPNAHGSYLGCFDAKRTSVVVAAAEQIDVDVVQQGGDPHLRISLGCLSYPVQPAWPALPARGPVRVGLFRVLLGQRPSLHDLLRPSPAFVRPLRWYYATVGLPFSVHLGLIAHRLLPPIRALLAA